mgnify:CR=1 FL=1
MKSLPKLEDVARLSGVSTATVSRVFNAPELVRAETRARVEAAVAELGYTPHFGGRALASNRTHTVGAVIPTMENAIFARGLQAMQETLAEAGVTLLVATSTYDGAREAAQIRALIGRGVDGLILIGEAREASVYELLEARGVPFVLVWSWRPDCPWTCIGFDNRAAAAALARRVLDEGHRRIAMIAGITRDNDRAAARVAGVRDALAEAGLELAPPRLVEAPYALDAGAEAVTGLLALDPRPTAILCGNDVLAAGAMLGLRAAGRAVPGEVSLTGFDDIELARLLDPPLTTVRVPHAEMGETAARTLLAMRGRAGGGGSRRLEARVVERGSLAPPPVEAGG